MSLVRQDLALKKSEKVEWYYDEKVEPHLIDDLKVKGSTSLLLLPDGRLASGRPTNHSIKLFNVKTRRFEMTLKGHESLISSLLLLPNGRLVSGADDQTIKFWNLQSGQCEKTLEGHRSGVSSLLLLRDGRLLSGSSDKTIKLWNVETGQCEKTLTGHSGAVTSLLLLPDGRVMSGSEDKTIKLWNLITKKFFGLITGECEKTLKGHSRSVTALLLLPDDGRMVSASADKTIKVWNVYSGQCEKTLTEHHRYIDTLIRLPGGRMASAGGSMILIWNLETWKCVKTLTGSNYQANMSLLRLPDGRLASGSRLVTSDTDPIKIWDIGLRQRVPEEKLNTIQNTQQIMQPFNKLSSAPQPTAIIQLNPSPPNTLLQTAVISQKPVWPTPDKTPIVKPVSQLTGPILPTSLSNTPFNTTTLHPPIDLAKPDELAVKKSEKFQPQCVKELREHSSIISSLLQLPDGRIVSGSQDATIKLWNAETGACEKTLREDGCVLSLILLPDGRIASGLYDKILFWNLKTGHIEKIFTGNWVRSLLLLPNGRVLSGSDDKTIKLWNVETRTCEKTLRGHNGNVRSLLLLSDGRVASGSDDKTIKLWNVETGVCETTLQGDGCDNSFLLLPDGRIVNVDYYGTFTLWNIQAGTYDKTLQAAEADYRIRTLLLLPDGQIASGDDFGTLKLWNTQTGTCDKILQTEDSGGIRSLLLLLDGRIAIGGSTGDISLWDIGLRHSLVPEIRTSTQQVMQPFNKFATAPQPAAIIKPNLPPSSTLLQISDTSQKPSLPAPDMTPIVTPASQLTSPNSITACFDTPFNITTLHQLIDLAKPDESVKFNEATFLKTQADLAKLTQQMQYVDGIVLQTLQGKAEELQSVVNKESLIIQSEQERRVILDDDKLSDYYYVFITQFTDVWLACKTIHSGKVENTEMTAIDYIPAILDKGAEYVSFPGVALLKDIATVGIKQWSARDKKMAVNRMANYFVGLVEGDKLIEAISRQLTLAQVESIQVLVLKKAGVFRRLVNGLKDIKNNITANDIDNVIRERADEDCQKIITAIMKGELKPHPTLTDVSTLVKVVLGNDCISLPSMTIKSSVKILSTQVVNSNEIKNNNSHAIIPLNLQTAQANINNINAITKHTTVLEQNGEQKDEITKLHEKLKRQEEESTALRQKIDQMEKLSWQGSDAASKHDLKQTQAKLDKLQSELHESGVIIASGNQAQMLMPSHGGKERTAATLADQKRIAALEAQVSLLTKNFANLLAQQGVGMLSPLTPASPEKQAKDEEIRNNLFKR